MVSEASVLKISETEIRCYVSRQQKWHRLLPLFGRDFQVFSCMRENTLIFQVTSCLRFVTTNVDFVYIESE